MLNDVVPLTLEQRSDNRGSLIAIEDYNLPFDIKRVYYIYKVMPGVSRGFHAHIDLKQLLIVVSGSVKIRCVDKHEKEEVFLLDSPNRALLIQGLVWREMFDFSDNAVLVVLASENYNEADYIRDYDEFQRIISSS